MKSLLKYFSLSAATVLLLWSCKKDENKVVFTGGTAPVLTTSTTTPNLSFVNSGNLAVMLSWTNPNYTFNTGVSSQDVAYIMEIDTTGANFTNPNKKTLSISKDLSISLLVSDLNDYMLNQLLLKPGIPHNLDVRIKSNIGTGAATLISNTIKLTATPYVIPPKVTPPAGGKLYITGDATTGNWMSAGDPELVSQRFTAISSTLFEITVPLTGGKSYTFVPVYGDWGNKYSIKTKNDPALVNGGDFQVGGEDILAPSETATYKVQVNFQTGKFTVIKQ